MNEKKKRITTNITIQNNLNIEERSVSVYHFLSKGTHLISYSGTIDVSLQSVFEGDYIYLSIVLGPGNMERQNIVDLPEWINYEFLSEGKFAALHQDNRILLKISAGLPEWKLKLTLPASHVKPSKDRVIISDDHDE